MIKYSVDGQYKDLNIAYQLKPVKIWLQLKSIIGYILLIILSLLIIKGFNYINNILDVIITITIFLVFSILQLINIYVNMRHKRFAIKMMALQIISMNIVIFVMILMFISFGVPTTVYPYFLGVILYSNIFNLLLHLSMNKPSFTEVNTYINDKTTTVKTKSRLLGFTGNWTIQFPHNGRSLKFRIGTSKNKFGFIKKAFLTADNYMKILENPSTFIDKNVFYSIHFIRTQQSGRNIEINKFDRVYLIGTTYNSEEITGLLSDLEKVTNIEYCLFVNTKATKLLP